MKKIIAIFLILTLAVTAFVVPTSAAWSIVDTTFAVASDLHYELQEEELEWFSEDPIYGYANRRAAMENESRYIIDEFLRQCAENEKIDAFYICPHHPDFDGDCDCRKPAPGLILKAAEEHNIDISSSVMIGDKLSDVKC